MKKHHFWYSIESTNRLRKVEYSLQRENVALKKKNHMGMGMFGSILQKNKNQKFISLGILLWVTHLSCLALSSHVGVILVE